MDQIFVQLGELFLGALPSTILLTILVVYFKFVLFGPLEKVMAERFRKTEGKEQQAALTLSQAETKTSEYEATIHKVKTEIYAQQDALRKRLEGERDAAVAAASETVKAEVAEARQRLEQELVMGRARIDGEAQGLATMIVDRVMERRTA